MQVAYLINQYPKVSHSFIRREIRALERRGIHVMRIALRGWADNLEDPADEEERKITHYVLRQGPVALLGAILQVLALKPLGLIQTLGLAFRMSQQAERPLPIHLIYLAEACRIFLWVRAEKVQHLHAHFGTNSAEIAMLVHALGGPSWSFTVHGPEEFDKPQLLHLRAKIRSSAFVIAICSYGRAQLYRYIEANHWNKVHVVHCGLEKEFFAAPPSLKIADRRLVCVGRLCEQKGQLLLVEAARRLLAENIDFELVLAGDGEMRREIEAFMARYKLENYVRITGWISEKQVADEISSARALVLASFAEGLPVVIMEAMALKRPIISTFIAGIPELVKPGEHGWLIPAGDIDALVIAMKQCLEAPDSQLRQMGEAGHQSAFSKHLVDVEAERLAELFSSPHGNELTET